MLTRALVLPLLLVMACGSVRNDDLIDSGGGDDDDGGSIDAPGGGDPDAPNDAMVPAMWGSEIRIGHDDAANQISNFFPQVAVSSNGDAIVVWYDQGEVWGRRYRRATNAWDALFQISDSASSGVNALVAIDDTGNAIVAWYRTASGQAVQARRFTASLGWPAGWNPVEVVQPAGAAGSTQTVRDLDITPGGDAVVAWDYRLSPANETYFRVYQQGFGWDTTRKSSGTSTTASNGLVGIAQVGNSLRVLAAYNVSATVIDAHAVVYTYDRSTHAGSLASSTPLESEASLSSFVHGVAMDAQGAGFAILYQRDGTASVNHVSVNRFDGASWGGAMGLDGGFGREPELAVNRAGQALVTYQQCSPCAVWARRYTTSWQPAAMLSPTDNSTPRGVGLDGNGRGLAIWWGRSAGIDSVYGAEMDANGGWTTGHLLETDDVNVYSDVMGIGFGHAGTGVAAWVREATVGGTMRRKIFGAVFAH